jgi:hypothetical protein
MFPISKKNSDVEKLTSNTNNLFFLQLFQWKIVLSEIYTSTKYPIFNVWGKIKAAK